MMKKILVLTIAMLMAAGTAFAVESTVTGRFIFEGSYYDNYIPGEDAVSSPNPVSFRTDDQYKFADYDMDWRINWKLEIAPGTRVFTRVSMHDETIGMNQVPGGGAWSGDAGMSLDDNIAIERAYLSQALSPKTLLDVGLMAGGAWGTTFMDNGDDYYRLKLIQGDVGPFDALIFLIEKRQEVGSDPNATNAYYVDQEKDDQDAYVLAAQFKTGPVTWWPAFVYMQNGYAGNTVPGTAGGPVGQGENDDQVAMLFIMAASGNHDVVGWEAEGTYTSLSFSDAMKPYANNESGGSLFGLYANVWGNLDIAKIGAWAAYGSYDKDIEKGQDFGDDFDSSMIIGDDLGGLDGSGDLSAATAAALYADFTVTEKLTISPKFVYSYSNVEDDDTTAMEFDIWGAFQLTDEVKYTVGFGYAMVDVEYTVGGVTMTEDTDPAMKLYHELRLDF